MKLHVAWVVLGALATGCGGDDSNVSGDDGSASTDASADESMSMSMSGDDDDDDDDDTATTEGTDTGPESSSDSDPDTSTGVDASSSDSGGTTGPTGTEDSSGTDDGSSSGDESSSTTEPTVLPDITGEHLLAVSISLAPDTPLQYIATVVQTPDGDGALLDVSLQPLTLDVGSTTSPRLPFGGAIDIDDVEVAADGTFEISIPVLDVAGECNPITGSDAAAANVVLSGQLIDDGFWCGSMDGDLTAPLMSPLVGSTFAGTAFEDDLPLVFEWSC